MKKTQPKKSTPQKPAVNAAPVVESKQPETVTPVVEKPQETSQPVTPAPVTTPPSASTEPPKDEKPKPPSISTVVRKLVILNPDKGVDEVSQLLIDTGWDAADVEKRKSTIATLRTDALAILKIAKECGWEKK
jgi:hypothetical protein